MHNEIKARIEKFVDRNLKNFKPTNTGSKVIHDPIWGSNLFYPWEIAIIDTPLFQRLRRIHQTGTAYFTYPSSTHSRFCHSLGVAVLADKLILKLREKILLTEGNGLIQDKDIYEARIAGLLHDFGHCFFSHTSEQIFEKLDFFNKLKKQYPIFKSKKNAPHEIYAYFIITSDKFRKFWKNNILPMFPNKKDTPSLDNIANIIIGLDLKPEKRFIREVITGPYDVDKLEYLTRDGYNAGLNIVYDIDRYFYKISVVNTSGYSKIKNEYRLVMDFGGIQAVEQLIFSKMMLFSYIYHHQKVRAADCLIRDIVYELLSGNGNKLIKIEHPCDFLNYTDYDILACALYNGKSTINKLIRKLQNRNLLKRCLVTNRDLIEGLRADQKVAANYEKLSDDMRDVLDKQLNMRKEIIKEINKKAKQKYELTDLYIDLPPVPSIEEAAKAPIKLPNGEIDSISEYFQLKGWQEIYELKKLRGYFFVNPEIISLANSVVKKYLDDRYNISFSTLSSLLAKISN